MRVRIRAALFLCAASLGAPAGAQNYPVKDATGATQTMASKLNGGVNFPEHVITDPTGAHGLVVTSGGAAMVDGSGVTQPVSIAGTLPGFTTEPTFKLDQTAANNGVQVVNSVAVTGTFWQATQPVSIAALPLPAGAATAALQPALNGDGGALAHVTNFPPSQAVTGTFWPTTQPVSAASLPLPTGAATATLQPALNGDGGAQAHVTNFPSSQAVTGTFWQTTQPVSETALPLPANAEQETGGNAAATTSNTANTATDIGAPGATACATDTGSCSQNAQLQRLLQRLSTLITTLGNPFQAGGSVGNTAFGISGTLPGFASIPVFSISGTLPAFASTPAVTISNTPSVIVSGTPTVVLGAGTASIGTAANFGQATASAAINVSTATATQLVALSSGKSIYVSAYSVVVAAADNVTLEYGTGTNCAAGATVLTGAMSFAANGGISVGSGVAPVLVVPASNALCIVTSAAVQASGSVSYAQF
jgi:hypothetical protein